MNVIDVQYCMRVASLGFMNIIARKYIIYVLVGNLPCTEFVYRVLCAELQIRLATS